MKVLAWGRPLSPSLYRSLGSLPQNGLQPRQPSLVPFIQSSLSIHCRSSEDSMAACIDTSRREKPQLSCDSNRHQVMDENGCRYIKYRRPDSIPRMPINGKQAKTVHTQQIAEENLDSEEGKSDVWGKILKEARSDVEREPILSNYYLQLILSQKSLESALANVLSSKLCNSSLQSSILFDLFVNVLKSDQDLVQSVKEDLRAVKERDPACISYVHCFLNFKGFLACQAHRIAHKLWTQDRKVLALLIQNRVSEVFAVDIHPGARIGRGILLDHATAVVMGETAVVGNDVSILHNVTLGGTGKTSGDRHPKIGDGVLIGAGTCILGNITIGDGAKIGAGSVVLKDIPPRTTVVGNPARLVGGKENPIKLDKIPSLTMDHTSHITEWSDYVI